MHPDVAVRSVLGRFPRIGGQFGRGGSVRFCRPRLLLGRFRGLGKSVGWETDGGLAVHPDVPARSVLGRFPRIGKQFGRGGACAFCCLRLLHRRFRGGKAVDREADGVFAVCPVASVSRFVFFRPPIGSLGERAEATGA